MSLATVVSVDDLEAGMVLADEVRDQQGRLLMPSGTELTDRHLRAFQLWGILSVRITSGDASEPAEPPVSAADLEAARALVTGRLRHTDAAHPFIAELVQLCTLREARRLARGAVHG